MTAEQHYAIDQIARRGRDIVTEEFANALLSPFGYTAQGLKIVYVTGEEDKGLDFGAGTERWGAGPQVDISTLAWVLADKLDAPDVEYDTNYGGAGKRAEAVTAKSILRLRKLAGEDIPTCADCGTADIWHWNDPDHDPMCYSCQKERDRRQQMCEVVYADFRGTFNGLDVNGLRAYETRQRYFGDVDMPWDERTWESEGKATTGQEMLNRFYLPSLQIALDLAYRTNLSLGLIGPVNVSKVEHL